MLDAFDLFVDEEDLPGSCEQNGAEHGSNIRVRCGEAEVVLHIADGLGAATHLVKQAAFCIRGQFDSGDGSRTAESQGHAQTDTATLLILSSTSDGHITRSDCLAGRVFPLARTESVIGRTDTDDIVITHASISRSHAKITHNCETGRYTITDLQSRNGVRVNGERCIALELNSGDIIDFGHVRTRFVSPQAPDWLDGTPPEPSHFLIVGNDVVIQRGEQIRIGPRAFAINEVEKYALDGGELPLAGGQRVQAALALLVVAAMKRSQQPANSAG
ncbi:MAG: FHA domain-containing protein [Gemmatimonadaceae bacterium]|nr:FHA domain-containing protein [Gemmatimonadaceae bacterium]